MSPGEGGLHKVDLPAGTSTLVLNLPAEVKTGASARFQSLSKLTRHQRRATMVLSPSIGDHSPTR